MQAIIAGNYCHDTLIHSHGTYHVLGGSSAYISAVFGKLAVSHEVVANVGTDFKYATKVSHPPLVVETHPTTHFLDDYSSESRIETLRAVCAPIRAADIARKVQGRRARIGMACGVAMEILPETLLKLRERCDVLICDVQGLVRATDESRKIFNVPLNRTPFVGVIGCVDYLKASAREAAQLRTELLPPHVRLLITDGARGSFLIENGKETHVAPVPTEEVDATGAGDCFLAGFAQGLLENLPAAKALERANLFGSLAVRQVGIPDFS